LAEPHTKGRAARHRSPAGSGLEQFPSATIEEHLWRHGRQAFVRKLIAFDDDTFDKLTQLARDRMATLQELADEAFADVLKKHGIPIDLKDALRKSAALSRTPAKNNASKNSARPDRSRKSTS
jgi:non-homologous end joining protein Ku